MQEQKKLSEDLNKKEAIEQIQKPVQIAKKQLPKPSSCTLQQKKMLKQQGKQLLLKGCYKMASNKFTRLIDMGIKQFTSRQQAIIFLNCGICFQFMCQDNRDYYYRALQYMRKALITDSTYQKTYYRLVQLLRDNDNLQYALSVVPTQIKNKQIDELLKEVRQQYINQSDFNNIIQKYKTQQLTVQNGKILLSKVTDSIQRIFDKNIDFAVQIQNISLKKEIQRIGSQILSIYELIGNVKSKNQNIIQPNESKYTLLQMFSAFLQSAFVAQIQDKKKTAIINILVQPSMKLYRGELSKFLSINFKFNNKQIKLLESSRFSNNNQFNVFSKRKDFSFAEINLLKYSRLVDVNLELFGKSYCYLSNKIYQNSNKLIQSQALSNEESFYSNKTLHKFLLSNWLDPSEVIVAGLKQTNPKIQYYPVHGGQALYLYKNLQITELNFFKQLLDEQCSKISVIYGSSSIHPIWLQNLKDVFLSLDISLDILLALVQIFSFRQSRNTNTLVNRLSQISGLTHLVYIYHWQAHAYKEKIKIEENQIGQSVQFKPPSYQFKYSYDQLLDYFEKQDENFITLYLIEKIIQFARNALVQKNNSSQQKNKQNKEIQNFDNYKERAIEICLRKVKFIETKIKQQKQNASLEHNVYKQMYLVLLCIILKLDIKRKITIDSTIIFQYAFKDIINDMALQVLLLILINSPNELNKYLQHQNDITNLVKNFLNKPMLQQLQHYKILLDVLYMLICDFQNDQQLYFAKKLGVTQKQVHQARKIQKQTTDQKQKGHLNKLKKKFKTYIALEWHQILNKLCKLLRITLKMEAYCSSKLCKIIYAIAELNHSKLYSTQIIQFMLQARYIKDQSNSLQNNTKQTACRFFQIICKKCNAQIFQYKHIQSIVDSLLWLISNCQHQLVYFESLLGLVNLSTISVRIPIEEIQKCLYEENSYIMHAGVCVMNNILIYNEDLQEDNEKNTKIKNRISDLIYTYIEFYRDQIISLQIQLPESDYSHPKKIYNSLISLATVLKLDKLQELESWNQAIKYIKILTNNEASDLLFKLAIYHSLEHKLPRSWSQGLQIQLQNLKKIEPQKYLKLVQLM